MTKSKNAHGYTIGASLGVTPQGGHSVNQHTKDLKVTFASAFFIPIVGILI